MFLLACVRATRTGAGGVTGASGAQGPVGVDAGRLWGQDVGGALMEGVGGCGEGAVAFRLAIACGSGEEERIWAGGVGEGAAIIRAARERLGEELAGVSAHEKKPLSANLSGYADRHIS